MPDNTTNSQNSDFSKISAIIAQLDEILMNTNLRNMECQEILPHIQKKK